MKIYRISKIINKNPNTEKEMYTICQYCKKYKTDSGWKSPEELRQDPEERKQLEDIEHHMKHNFHTKSISDHTILLSHGLCPECYEKMVHHI